MFDDLYPKRETGFERDEISSLALNMDAVYFFDWPALDFDGPIVIEPVKGDAPTELIAGRSGCCRRP